MRYVLTLLLSILIFTSASAGNVELMSDGSMRIIDNEVVVVERLDITVSPEAMVYPSGWKEAIQSPDVPIEVGRSKLISEPAGFNVRIVTETISVVYDTVRKEVLVVKTSTSTEEFNIFYVFAIATIVLMGVALATSFMNLLRVANFLAILAFGTAAGAIMAGLSSNGFVSSSAAVIGAFVTCIAFLDLLFDGEVRKFRRLGIVSLFLVSGASVLMYVGV